MTTVLTVLIIVWIFGLVIAIPMAIEDIIKPHEAACWPLALVKYFVRSAYLVLFTGWRQ